MSIQSEIRAIQEKYFYSENHGSLCQRRLILSQEFGIFLPYISIYLMYIFQSACVLSVA